MEHQDQLLTKDKLAAFGQRLHDRFDRLEAHPVRKFTQLNWMLAIVLFGVMLLLIKAYLPV